MEYDSYFSKLYEELAQEKTPTIEKWLISAKELFEYEDWPTLKLLGTDPQEEKLLLSEKVIQSHS